MKSLHKNNKIEIIATLGKESGSKENILKLIDAGATMFRLNFSWGTHEEKQEVILNIRRCSLEKKKLIPIIQDLSGPREQKGENHYIKNNETETITKKDINDLIFGIKNHVEYIAMSFVKDVDDIKQLKSLIKEHNGDAKVIAKIERKEAIENLGGIIKESDAVMVARGDLGNAFPLEQIPFIQHDIITRSNDAKKIVIVATQMLLSMVNSPIPTRAEISDVSYAIIDGADAVMLSEETAIGKYGKEAVSIMYSVVEYSTKHRNEIDII